MKIHCKILLSALAAILFAAPAFAAYQDEEGGAYVSLNVGEGLELKDCTPPGIATSCVTDRNVHAYIASYGYRYSPFWALEASYGKLGYITSARYGIMPFGISVSGVFNLNVIDAFEVYAKVGLTYVNFQQHIIPPAAVVTAPFNQNGTAPSGGVGIRFAINPKLDFMVQGDYFGSYTLYTGTSKVSMFAGTVGFRVKY